jgi:hypothetical protein
MSPRPDRTIVIVQRPGLADAERRLDRLLVVGVPRRGSTLASDFPSSPITSLPWSA